MRTAFIKTLIELAGQDERIFFLTGDLGYGVVESFRDKFPKRFINMGVAEQNMVGTAAGLAMSGKIPITYSIVTFVALRPLEFIRNDVCYQNLNVKIVGVGAGFSYPQYAATHQAIDDVAILRILPNLVILNPGDPIETRLATIAALKHVGPVYIRIGKKGEPDVHKEDFPFVIGKAVTIKNGKDFTVIATGNILENTAKAVALLEKSGFSVRFLSMPTIKPIDQEAIKGAAKETKAIFTVEETFDIGGLGTATAEVLAELSFKKFFKKIAIPNHYPKEIGSQNYLRGIYGLQPDQIAATIKQYFKK